MLFLSQLINAPLIDSADDLVGRLTDVICRPAQEKFPPVLGIAYKDRRDASIKTIDIEIVENLSHSEISLKTLAHKLPFLEPDSSALWLKRDIFDKQIVDVSGTRVVRANDIRLGMVQDELYVLGIDVSTRGILRRLGIDRWGIFSFIKPQFIDWEKVQLVGKSLKLTQLSKELTRLHPADLANIVEDLNPHHSKRLMRSLDPRTAAKVFEELTPEFKRDILKSFDPEKLATVLSHISMDELVDYLKLLAQDERRKVIGSLSEPRRRMVEEFISYKDDSAGGLMTTEFAKAKLDWTVQETKDYIKKISPSCRSIYFLYVLDEKGYLKGIVSLRTLVISKPTDTLEKIMKHVKMHQSVHLHTDLPKIALIMTRYNLLSVAVLDKDKKLVGVVTVDDVMKHLVPHA